MVVAVVITAIVILLSVFALGFSVGVHVTMGNYK